MEVAAEQKAIKEIFEKAATKAKKVRKQLTSRYDVELPDL